MFVGYFLMKNEDMRSRVSDFLTVLNLHENEMSVDAYYDLKNVALRKPIKLPKDDDVRFLWTSVG